MTTPRAVIFDLDDTLYAERTYVRSGFGAVARRLADRFGVPAADTMQEFEALFEQGIRRHTFDRWLERQALPGDQSALVRSMVEAYRDHDPILTPFEGMPELVADIRRHCMVGVITDGPLSVQKRKWRALPYTELINSVVYSDAFGRHCWKPSPVPFEATLRAFGIPPEDATYVGDNPVKDFLGARALGLATIRFRSPDGIYASLEPESLRHAPDVTVTSVPELHALLMHSV